MEAFVILSAVSSAAQGLAGHAAGKAEANRLDAQARMADTQAIQRDTQMRDELSRFMSSMKSARSANGLSNTSPNALLLMANANKVSSQERTTMTANDRQNAANLRAGAASARQGAKFSLITGIAKAAVPIAQYKM